MRTPQSNPVLFIVAVLLAIVLLGFSLRAESEDMPYGFWLRKPTISEGIGDLLRWYCAASMTERKELEAIVNQHAAPAKAFVVCYHDPEAKS